MLVENMTVSQRSVSVWSIGLEGTYKLTESLILQLLVYRYIWALAVILSCQIQLSFFISLFRNKIVCEFLVSPLYCKTRPPNTVQFTVHDTRPISCISASHCTSSSVRRSRNVSVGITGELRAESLRNLVPFLTKVRNISLLRKVQNDLGPMQNPI